MGDLPHLDDAGNARMVDVGAKPSSARRAIARADLKMQPATADALFGGSLPKGDALAVARIAGIQAAKRTADLIPLCHPLFLTSVAVEISPTDDGARIETRVETTGQTGVEMEALTAASVAALTLYDMVKSLERGVEVTSVCLVEKSGGKSGTWQR
ncbi:MAG: cyclic pyranopterin monophosphate synthase MoaC [Acidimicrobiia bacterium]|nr:cyclic pyranopterin monophosphate synthase MoaC [Acidimicrobiia bacterium]NNF09962.1 cyclic pyranopterin monophosphate synthase MoaC [Acidimicrobiia bacterium]NNL70982.1 cyclic pyranopterin monophosphate synthase MoaC [Acidimicrobiia bacterium]